MQFDLDGFVFGSTRDEVVILGSGFETGEMDVRDQDTPHPAGDGVWFGRDFLSPPTWQFTLGVRDHSGVDVMPVLWRLAEAWRGDKVRKTPGAVSTLKYCLNGRERVVFGRPRRFAVEGDDAWQRDWKIVTCEFVLSDPRSFSGDERSLRLELGTVQSTDGLTFPADFDWVFAATTVERAGSVVVDSSVGSPFRVHIAGPAAGTARDFRVWSDGWRFEFPTTLGPFGNITVDTLTGTAIRNGQVFGAASARTDWRAELAPGPQDVRFTADDPSGSVTATIYWRDSAPAF